MSVTVDVINGSRNEVQVSGVPSHEPIFVGSAAYAGILPEVILPIASTGQTRFNVGGSEPRRSLHLNGVRYRIGIDYTITLPYIDWVSAIMLEPSDELILTF